jgi:hypothetical protein
MAKYIDIQDEVIREYRIIIDTCSQCRRRTHAHVKQRRVCKWHQKNSAECTFELLHEIGHIETTKSNMRRCEAEFYATEWAIQKAKEYDFEIPEKTKKIYQDYINREKTKGIRRHGAGYGDVNLKW